MIRLLLHLLRLLPVLFGGHRQLVLENLTLRQQIAVYKRRQTRPRLRRTDRLFWAGLARIWPGWRQALVIVTPDTVLRWQRRRFRDYWAQLSARTMAGRPPVNAEIRALITHIATANPLWGAPRIHGELVKLGIDVAERTVSRLMPKRRPQPSQTWRTFLANHVQDLVSVDFFTVPTARLRVLFVLVVLAHHRRRVVHFNVTEHPTALWTAQQIVEAFPDDSAPSYLLRDRDRVYGQQFRHRVKGMRIKEVLTAPRSPWQNPFAERLIGSIRRECLSHVLVLDESHLRRILTRYFSYYHHARTHLALDKDTPDPRPIEPPAAGMIVEVPEVGGLHHRCLRQAAWYLSASDPNTNALRARPCGRRANLSEPRTYGSRPIDNPALDTSPHLHRVAAARRIQRSSTRVGRRYGERQSHTSTSNPNTRWSNRAQGQRRGISPSAGRRASAGEGFGTTAALHSARGARGP
jgi:transposase InsO family protein